MYKIILTHGRHHEVADGPALESEGGNLSEVVNVAIQAMLMKRQQRGDGLPDGYLIIDDKGEQVKAEWFPLTNSPSSSGRAAPGRRYDMPGYFDFDDERSAEPASPAVEGDRGQSAIEKLRRSDEQITVLSCGIVASRDLAGSVGESTYDKLRREFRNAVAIETHRYGAFMAVAMGETHIATFGSNNSEESHALRALRAAHAIQQRLRTYLDPDVVTLPVQIGLHTDIGRSDPVVKAEALEARAGAGGILMSRATLNVAGDLVHAERVGMFQIGIGSPIEALRLITFLPPSPLGAPRTATTADRDSAEIESELSPNLGDGLRVQAAAVWD